VGLESSEEPIPISGKIFRALIQLKDTKLLLLIPIIFYSGMEQGFVFGSFTSDIVQTTIGKGKIGFVMTVFGAVNVAGSFFLGKVADRFGTPFVFITGFISHILCLCGMFIIYTADGLEFFKENSWMLYLISGLWGLGDAAWNNFPNTMLSILYTDDAEPAFANLKLWQSLGTVLAFATGNYLDINVKLVGVFGFLWVAVMALIYLQIFYQIFNRGRVQTLNETPSESLKFYDHSSTQ